MCCRIWLKELTSNVIEGMKSAKKGICVVWYAVCMAFTLCIDSDEYACSTAIIKWLFSHLH